MFHKARWFNQNLNQWNVDKVTYMRGMFYDAKYFNQKVCWDTTGKDTYGWLSQSGGITRGC